MSDRAIRGRLIAVALVLAIAALASTASRAAVCERVIRADVVALDQPFWYNRLGTIAPHGMIFALKRDVVRSDGTSGPLAPGAVMLRPDKRPRPMVLRANEGDCLEITFTNLLAVPRADPGQPLTRDTSVHVMGMQLVNSIADDGSWVGRNDTSLAGPGQTRVYTLYAEREGAFLLYSTGINFGGFGGGTLNSGLFGAVHVQPRGSEWYRSQVTNSDLTSATSGYTASGHPIVDYGALYPPGHPRAGTPILAMLQNGEIMHTDLTAIITGPNKGWYSNVRSEPMFYDNRASPDRRAPYREFSLFYHGETEPNQAFPDIFFSNELAHASKSGLDAFAINYGSGGIAAEIVANRLGVGSVHDCTGCKYEEFFLSSWPLGDPAMVVDVPANATDAGGNLTLGPKATQAFYPDDPSNVYHGYIGDHTKFRIHHAGPKEHHIHHLHAHQWLLTPNSDDSTYMDSQAIGPGTSYTLEITYDGAGNRNQTVGDSIFHCHFYPHFAEGMWGLWRVHDVLETGTPLGPDGRPVAGSRALPDAEIVTGTPIPALVPVPGNSMPPLPGGVEIVGGEVVLDQADLDAGVNPGYPFFIPGVPGHRPPHPPLDTIHDGGLPRHVLTGGETRSVETRLDFTKEYTSVSAIEVAEDGTQAERVAMSAHSVRSLASFKPDGSPATFKMNGLPPVHGAPFADPCVDDDGNPVGNTRLYKAANIQMDVILNKKGWHFPQQRLITLWEDVGPTLSGLRPPEPFFFRANSGDCIEFQHTNLVPNVYELDDFQVRTPTDILGQHIHLVKFDVTSSDGSGNGYNYEDGNFSPDEVRERIHAIRHHNGCAGDVTGGDPRDDTFECPVAKPHPFFGAGPGGAYLGATTSVQRWYADPLLNMLDSDRTLRTVFTHDHFGPSTHQQAGLYSGLLVEPDGAVWRDQETGELMGGAGVSPPRSDGGPTSWRVDVWTADPADSYREFAIEFQDFQLAYTAESRKDFGAGPGRGPTFPKPWDGLPRAPGEGFDDPEFAIAPPLGEVEPGGPALDPNLCAGGQPRPCPELLSSDDVGTYTLNYRNEPPQFRITDPLTGKRANGPPGDHSHLYRSILRADPDVNVQPNFYPPLSAGIQPTDPYTPLMRAYEGDRVQIRSLVGATEEMHYFTLSGLRWLFEPSDPNSGYMGGMFNGISEHFEYEFTLPPAESTPDRPFADYLYNTSTDIQGVRQGIWGLLRAYDGKDSGLLSDLQPLPSNPDGRHPAAARNECPANAPRRFYDLKAVTGASAIPGGSLIYNPRNTPIHDPKALLYVRTSDLDAFGRLLPTVPIEPLVLRAAAGECLEIRLTNGLPGPLNGASGEIGLIPQLLSYDVTKDHTGNIGFNPVQTIRPGQTRTFRWYAGLTRQTPGGTEFVPVEFGSINLMPSDPLEQHRKGLIGGLIIEPEGSTWVEDLGSRTQATITKPDGSTFREAVVIFQDDLDYLWGDVPLRQEGHEIAGNTQAINYRTEPMFHRLNFAPDLAAELVGLVQARHALSNTAVGGDPVTPIFTASPGEDTRFRVLHPGGKYRGQVFHLHGHGWPQIPWADDSTRLDFKPSSQWHASQGGVGPGTHFNLLIGGAGGAFEVPGDYLYRSMASEEFAGGLWGIFRVGDRDAPCAGGCAVLDDVCLEGVCNPETGQCEAWPANEGGQCNDGNAASTDDRCTAGVCRGNFPNLCGNGLVDPGEQCDDGNTIDTDLCSNACTFNVAPNVIENGDFAAGTTPWRFSTNGNASFDVIGGEARIAVVTGGSATQLYQPRLSIEGGRRYELTFRARHDGSGWVAMRLFQHASPNTDYGLNEWFQLSPTMQLYRMEFTTTPGFKSDARFQVWMSRADFNGSTFFFDDISIREMPNAGCGNGQLDPGEVCDGSLLGGETCESQGLAGGTLACNATCTAFDLRGCSACGDGIVNAGEGCDDGGTLNGDGCTSVCTVEPGFACSGQPSVCVASCGNGLLDAGEVCDNGLGNSDTTPDACRTDCMPAACGDGVVDTGEQCDDGNTIGGDACSNTCTINVVSNLLVNGDFFPDTRPWRFATNGTGTLSAANGGARIDIVTSGSSVQLYQFDLALEGNTTYLLTFRARHTVGGSIGLRLFDHLPPNTNFGLHETFDLTTVESDYAFEFTTTPGDKANARLMFWLRDSDFDGSTFFFKNVVLMKKLTGPGVCGDGVIGAGEVCDGAALGGQTCVSMGFDSGSLSCNSTCDGFLTGACVVCGDGVIDPGEQCDDGLGNSDLLPDACRTDCTVAACGDGVTDTGEECDDNNTVSGDGCSSTCTIEAGNPPLANLVVNGDFGSGTSPWRLSPSSAATFSTSGGVAEVAVTTGSSSLQLYQSGIALKASTTYRVTVTGRNTVGDNPRILVIKHTSPFTRYVNVTVPFGTTDSTQTFTFTTPGAAEPNARFQIWLGNQNTPGTSFFFDQVTLEEVP